MTDILETLILISSIMLLIALFLFIFYRGKAFLMFFQQEEYDGRRFLNWVTAKGAFDKRTTLIVILGLVFKTLYIGEFKEYEQGMNLSISAYLFILSGGFSYGAWISRYHLQNAKKALVITTRAKRIFSIYFILFILIIYIKSIIGYEFSQTSDAILLLMFLQAPPIFIILSNTLLIPIEALIKAGYVREAKAKLKDYNPIIIGITGSYGKTSTKHILNHILSTSYQTLATPGSVNTEMGICRTILEDLQPEHKYFIAEMGAYGEGAISKLCDLCPPKFGIITGIGVAHFERFKSISSVFKTKFELAEAVKKAGGYTLVNDAAIPSDLIDPRLQKDKSLVPIGSISDKAGTLSFLNIKEKRDGLHLNLSIKEKDVSFFVPIYGTQQAGNIALSIAMALRLGYPISTIKAALKTLPQTRHRQEVTLSKSGPSVIDDAYNSNPLGFMGALDTLNILGSEGGKRILITPGMVELGGEHDPKHLEVGTFASERVDIALVVTPNRIPTFVEGLKGGNTQVELFDTQEEAETRAKALAGDGDIILFENNLPDLFESDVKF